ncbi:MAG: SpoIIE family protein phosphatase, partial [Oscillospiraceae bacterium]|nr:SpoIIE family protein phosphatase [Oscillospiraceae bacterium]
MAKSALVYRGLSFEYNLYRILEAVALYFIAQLAVEGAAQLKTTGNIPSFTDAVCILTVMTVVAVSASGADSHWLYPGYALILGACWYYTSVGRLGHSFICLVAALLTVADRQGFIRLFIATAALWLVGCYFSERLSAGIYPAIVLLAFGINIISVSQLASLALTGSSIMALVIYTLIPHMTKAGYVSDTPRLAEGRDWRLLMLSMQKLEDSLSFLAGCVIDISRLNEKQLKSDSLEDMVAEDVCRKCSKNHYCWQEKYSFTQQQLSEYGKKMYWAQENRFSAGFCAQCINVGDIVKSFEENSRLLLSKKYIAQSQRNNQKMLQNAFLSISSAVGDMIYRNQHSYLLNSTITMETERFLNNIGVQHTYCLCSQNPDQVSFSVLEPIDDKTVYKIHNQLEKLYSVRFLSPVIEQQGVELLYIFCARPVYECETALETSRYKNINGDNREFFINNGKAYVLLSDGMGTGSAAAAESHTVIAMAKSLIMTGVSMKNIISIINLAMNLKGSGEAGASIDILETDLFTGKSTITKAGAGVSMVLNNKGVTRYYQDSLPLGILKDVKAVECSFTLQAGDTVILMSDGAGVVS